MQKRIKFTGPFKNSISFDKREICKKLLVYTFREARRSADIYSALIKEFYEEGCLTSAKYFQILLDKEGILYENGSIRDRISDEPKLLLSLFDSCKMAEKATLSDKCNGPVICTRLLLQCILMLESYGKKYDWILTDVFRIIIKISTKVCQAEEVLKEPLCQIYYKFGVYLMKCDFEESVKYLGIAFNLAEGTDWVFDEKSSDDKSLYFSQVIVKMYASALLYYAKDIFTYTPEYAITQAQKALVILRQVGVERNKSIYMRINLDMAEFYIKAENYERSLLILDDIVQIITTFSQENVEYLKFFSSYHHLKGVCFHRNKKYDLALVELYKSHKIVCQLKTKYEEGIILLDIAKVYIDCGRSQFRMAESCLRQSKEIFVDLNDMFNVRKTSYLMANLKVNNIQPMIFDLIKFSSTNYCDKYRLSYWKSLRLPFWRNLQNSFMNEERNSLHCLLQGKIIPARKCKRKSFQRKAQQC